MSRIFEALQRWDAERVGTREPTASAQAGVLERAERQAASEWGATVDSEEPPKANVEEARPSLAPHAMLENATAVEALTDLGVLQSAEGEELFRRIQRVEVSPPERGRLVCLTDRESTGAEAFNLLRVRLRHLRRDRPIKRLLITSTIPEEGKSFAAANLACALASGGGQRTLLLEGDLRRPSLSQSFGLATGPGISQYLQGGIGLRDAVYRLEGPGIWFLPAGSAPKNPLEIIQSPKLPLLLEQLAEWFDWIIVDSPPVLPLADTSIWARLVDGILLVARRGTTERRKHRRRINNNPVEPLSKLLKK